MPVGVVGVVVSLLHAAAPIVIPPQSANRKRCRRSRRTLRRTPRKKSNLRRPPQMQIPFIRPHASAPRRTRSNWTAPSLNNARLVRARGRRQCQPTRALPAIGQRTSCPRSDKIGNHGSEWGPVVLPVFKTGRSPHGGGAEFDSQALPPSGAPRMAARLLVRQAGFAFGSPNRLDLKALP